MTWKQQKVSKSQTTACFVCFGPKVSGALRYLHGAMLEKVQFKLDEMDRKLS